MNRIKLFIHEPSINEVIGRELDLMLNEKLNLVDVVAEIDKMIRSKGTFPIPDYHSLLHMIYNPVTNRFYNQVAISAYKHSGQLLNVRDDPKRELPNGTTVTLIPAGGCISEWEEAIDLEAFFEAISRCK
ncbi:hypothetical protein GWN49_03500 [Candidatus Bathyarchaeota archaeon]|nr:hypothetical protein [Candidatus Bathyarchaeota archaeon]